MKELETLLNSLIKMGWEPWGKLEANECTVEYQKQVCVWNKHYRMLRKGSLRELVSLESGLWQFCMENGLCKGDIYERIKADLQILGAGESHQSGRDYQYRLLESALVPEEELEEFLLNNIIVEGKKE